MIAPFVSALKTLCSERSYLVIIHGEGPVSNKLGQIQETGFFDRRERPDAIYSVTELHLDEPATSRPMADLLRAPRPRQKLLGWPLMAAAIAKAIATATKWAALPAACLAIGVLPPPSHVAWAQNHREPVDLELVLAVDISGSIDGDEARLQREGYVAALTDPEVIKAIQGGVLGKAAMTYIEWAGEDIASTVADWAVIEDEKSARSFASVIANAPLQTALWTSISNAIDYGLATLESNAYQGTRRVIDISGDGPNNQGGPVAIHRDVAISKGVIINGLPIVNERPSPFGWPALPDLDLYYATCVIGGPGAFYVVADTFSDFARAIRKKLILEIAGARPVERIFQASAAAPREAPPCDIGERRLQWLLEN